MAGLILLGIGIYIVVKLVEAMNRSANSNSERRSPPTVDRTGTSSAPKTKSPPTVYRPTAGKPKSPVRFNPVGHQSGQITGSTSSSLSEINDAFTGRRLNSNSAIYECTTCHVFYQSGSMEVLREANNAKCMVCGSTQIARHGETASRGRARNYTPDVVTLHNYREHIGQVITFTGRVCEVKRSRTGLDFAVMFERKPWAKGLKMVAFKGSTARLGGASKLMSYAGKTLTIRGLLIQHSIFGPEIIVDDPAMIIRVDR